MTDRTGGVDHDEGAVELCLLPRNTECTSAYYVGQAAALCCLHSFLFCISLYCLVSSRRDFVGAIHSSLFIDTLSNMIVHPEMLAKASSSVAPIPTVIPGVPPVYETAGDVGNRTLWYAASGCSPSCAANKTPPGLSLSSWPSPPWLSTPWPAGSQL